MEKKKDPENEIQPLPFCMCIGLSVGTALGAGLHNIPIGMCIGLCAGLCIGGLLDAKARKESKESEE